MLKTKKDENDDEKDFNGNEKINNNEINNETDEIKDNFEDDVRFEELNSDGEEMNERQKNKRGSGSEIDRMKSKYEEKIARLEKEKNEYLSGWQRMKADYENREKEIEEYKKTFITFANEKLIKDILPVLDGYEIAKANKDLWESVDQNWRIGVEYLFSQLQNTLSNNGLKTFGQIGDIYDVNIHEIVEIVNLSEDEKENNDKIINVLQKGFMLGEKLLRPARVKIGKYEN